ncbi:MAG: YadA C-terminal domain-containing protein, partial [Phascolarctobacterium sp.]|nr:YadA C-terminal domain-containing protein [Phascolarctobacterium sp.]
DGINQRLDKNNTQINKVGAGAAALAALHPLEYDPDDKLTLSAGMGNYAGENAAALGAFYRPNEKFMLSLGGTMGNGENMVNLGLSIGLDKASGLAKLSKRELIQKVNAVEAENDALEDRVAKLEALVAQLAKK